MQFKRILTTTLAGLMMALGVVGRSSVAQDAAPATAGQAKATAGGTQPAAILSITNLDRLLSDVSYMLKATNFPEVGGLISVMANTYTQGLDRTRPMGLVVKMQGSQAVPIGFLPVKIRAAFFSSLAAIGVEPDDLGDGRSRLVPMATRFLSKNPVDGYSSLNRKIAWHKCQLILQPCWETSPLAMTWQCGSTCRHYPVTCVT